MLIQDSNQIRGQWKLGKVSEVFAGEDGIVRKVHVAYKNPKPGEPAHMYNGRGYITVERSVNRLVLPLPVDENKEQQSYPYPYPLNSKITLHEQAHTLLGGREGEKTVIGARNMGDKTRNRPGQEDIR